MKRVTFTAEHVTVRAVHVTRRLDAAARPDIDPPPTMMPLATTNTLKFVANFASLGLGTTLT